MATLALSCLALLVLAASVVEADLSNSKQWEEVDLYARANNDFDGHSLVRWYNRDFKDATAKRHADTKLREVLELIVFLLSANKPEDCDAEHLNSLSKFEKGGLKFTYSSGLKFDSLVEMFMKQSEKYSELCQLKVNDDFKEAVKTLDPTQLELVNRFTKTTLDKDGRPKEYDWMINGLLHDVMKHYYLQIEDKYDNFDKKALAAACKSYVSAVDGVFGPLETYLRKIRITTYAKVKEVQESRLGFVGMVYCKTFLQESWMGKAVLLTDIFG